MGKQFKTGCGDWHLSWGLGTFTIGKLYTTDQENIFEWKGHSQGRHGQIHWRGGFAKVQLTGEEVEILEFKKGHPKRSEIKKSIDILLALKEKI